MCGLPEILRPYFLSRVGANWFLTFLPSIDSQTFFLIGAEILHTSLRTFTFFATPFWFLVPFEAVGPFHKTLKLYSVLGFAYPWWRIRSFELRQMYSWGSTGRFVWKSHFSHLCKKIFNGVFKYQEYDLYKSLPLGLGILFILTLFNYLYQLHIKLGEVLTIIVILIVNNDSGCIFKAIGPK